MKNKLIITILSLLGLIGGYFGYQSFGAVSKPEIVYPELNWTRPKTDTEWNEDVKKEGVDLRSTPVLENMLEMHTAKVERLRATADKWLQCPECKRWEIREQLKDSGMTDVEIEAEYQSSRKSALEDWERLNRAVERIGKELELREKGFVVIESELLGAQIPPERVRHIIDK